MVPPAALITRCAEAAVAPALYRTTYSLRAVARFDNAGAVGAAPAGTTNAATVSAAPAQPVATRDLCFNLDAPSIGSRCAGVFPNDWQMSSARENRRRLSGRFLEVVIPFPMIRNSARHIVLSGQGAEKLP